MLTQMQEVRRRSLPTLISFCACCDNCGGHHLTRALSLALRVRFIALTLFFLISTSLSPRPPHQGKFYLEDFDGHVALDLSECKLCHGLYTENAVVIVEAYYANKMLHVLTLGFPPPEPREVTLCVVPRA